MNINEDQDSSENRLLINAGSNANEIVVDDERLRQSSRLTRPQIITTTLLVLYFFLSSAYYSLFAPFFPAESIKKGINQTQVGIIFGIFEFVLLILSPVFGKYLQVFGIRFLFVWGVFLSSGSEFLFGFLDACPNGPTFFIMCCACRVVSALGSSMGMSYAIVGHYFPDRLSTIVALLEVSNGFGYMVGPVIGGVLFEFGGFRLPFFMIGGVNFLVFVVAFFIFPDEEGRLNNNNDSSSLPMLPLLKNFRLLLTLLLLLTGSMSIGFIQPAIQLHLAPLKLSPIQLGAILIFPSLLYMITTPIVGYVCDKSPKIIPLFMFVSSLISAASYSFFGPIPFYDLPLNLWVFLGSFIIYGLSIGVLTIPVYSELNQIAKKIGYPNDLRTQGLISGIFGSVFSLGALLGPVCGGVIVDQFGFNLASFGVVLLFLVGAVLFGTYHSFMLCKPNLEGTRLVLDGDSVEPAERVG